MTYRGVYRDGVIVLSGDVDLREGDSVDVNKATRSVRPAAKKKQRKKAKATKVHPVIALAGIWKDRADWKGLTTLEVIHKLRRRSSQPATKRKARRG